MEGWFGFSIGVDIAALFVVLWVIFYGDHFKLSDPVFLIVAVATIIVSFLVWAGVSPQWLWIPGIWILGLGIPYVAGFTILVHLHIRNRRKKTGIHNGYV